MDKSISDVFYIVISLIVSSVLFSVCFIFTEQARKAEVNTLETKVLYQELKQTRYWSDYEGQKTGADIADFIVRHKDVCDIVISGAYLSANSKINGYLTGGSLIMGISDKKNILDSFWDITFIYDNIINKNGSAVYIAVLLYDGQLSPEYESGVQVRGGMVTGIEYTLT